MTTAECIEEIRRVIGDALLQSSAFATYYDPEVLESLAVAHKRYRTFMRAAEDAHLGHAVVLLYSLQETRRDTSSFIKLGRLIESETGTPPSEIPRFHEILEEEVQEGRQLYEARVDQQFLNDKDYLQEAFDNFISKKKTAVS